MDLDKRDTLDNITKHYQSKKIILQAGKQHSICTCGHSKNIPFCDNSHRKVNEEKDTDYKSLKVCPEKDIILDVYSPNWNLK